MTARKPRPKWPAGLGRRIARIQAAAAPVDMRPGELGAGLVRATLKPIRSKTAKRGRK